MKKLRLFNSLAGQVEEFVPLKKNLVRVYHCGPTVYKRQHLGNMRRYLFADFLHRTLKFLGFEVEAIMNITDVGHLTADEIDAGEDKLEVAARERHLTPADIAQEQTELFFADLKALNIERASLYPRATDNVQEMQDLIQKLITAGHAYKTSTGVYFDVATWPDYGKLSGNTLEMIDAGARVAVREEKKQPADFALWKIAQPEHRQQWDSPWGRGFPGWHIECSAMSLKYLGKEIDIHTGGEDNRFPHHENEIAQAEAAGYAPFVRFWLHNAHLQMQGAKMAKREGAQLTVDTLREKNISPLAFRLLVFGAHYRQKLEFSWEALAGAQESLTTLKNLMRRLLLSGAEIPPNPPLSRGAYSSVVGDSFGEALANDLGTPRALAVLMDYVREANTSLDADMTSAGEIRATLMEMDEVLGVLTPLLAEIEGEKIPAEIEALAARREAARAAGDFAGADKLRDEIEAAGWRLEDTPKGPRLVPSF